MTSFVLLAFYSLGAAMAKIGATLLAVNRKNTVGVRFCPAGIMPF